MEKLATVRLDNLPEYAGDPTKGEVKADWPAALKIYREALDQAGATTPAQITAGAGPMDTAEMTLGLLKGKDYWIAGIASFDGKDRRVTLTLTTLPDGRYEVVDITGERPIIRADRMAGYALAGDPEYREAKVLAASVANRELATAGIANLEVKAGMGRILLIRPAGKPVYVECPEYEVKTIALRKVGVNVLAAKDASGEVRLAARDLVETINRAGGTARLSLDIEIKRRPVTFDAFIQPEKDKGPEAHKIAVFNNQPIETSNNLIVIGSTETSRTALWLAEPGAFTYDKVCEKITGKYPGPGRGLIGVVESINDPSFDPTDQTRDALLVGGSDDAGTLKAIAELKRIIETK
jgi:hypothetical protein